MSAVSMTPQYHVELINGQQRVELTCRSPNGEEIRVPLAEMWATLTQF